MQWYVGDVEIRKYSTVVANGTARHCKLKQSSKIVLFNSNTFVGFLPINYVKYQLNSILNLTSKWN